MSKRYVRCVHCGEPALRLFLCPGHWNDLPSILRRRWYDAQNMRPKTARFRVALEIFGWRPKP